MSRDIRSFLIPPSPSLPKILNKYCAAPADLDQVFAPPQATIINKPKIIHEIKKKDITLKKPQKNKSNLGINYEIADTLHWTYTSFPWDSQLESFSKSVFGINKFRANQKGIINATKSNRNVFVCMPTGSGKSLCFQLPALLEKGVTLVIMPLL